MQAPPINQDEMQQLLEWLDGIPFSKPKKNIVRDFADGVFVAQLMKLYFPDIVQIHNYVPVSAQNARYSNWKTLNQKVFKKLKFQINASDISNIIKANAGTIERVLFVIFNKIRKIEQQKALVDNSLEGRNPLISQQSKLSSQMSAKLVQKDQTIQQLSGTIQILQIKMKRMQQLNRLKDAKIQSLIRKLQEGIN